MKYLSPLAESFTHEMCVHDCDHLDARCYEVYSYRTEQPILVASTVSQ